MSSNKILHILFCSTILFFFLVSFANAKENLCESVNRTKKQTLPEQIDGIEWAKYDSVEYEFKSGPKLSIRRGLTANHSGPNGFNSVRTDRPIPAFILKAINKPTIIFYFEMQILNKTPRKVGGIYIGFCDEKFPLEGQALGWDNSIGIGNVHGIWNDRSWNEFENTYDDFKQGDFIGIGIIQQPTFKIECFATLNGKFLGKVELPLKFALIELFPAVNLYDADDSIHLHFERVQWQFKDFKHVIE